MSERLLARGPWPALIGWTLVAVWAFGLLIVPLGALALRSVWSWETGATIQARELDRLDTELQRLHRDFDAAVSQERRWIVDSRIQALGDRRRALEHAVPAPAPIRGGANWQTLLGPTGMVLLTTLARAALVTCLVLPLALAIAWGIAGTPSRRRPWWLLALYVPCVLPATLRARGWTTIVDLLGYASSEATTLTVVTSWLVPFAVPPILTALARVGPAEVEAARDLGARSPFILGRVVVPAVAPALVFAGSAIFALALGAHAVPWIAEGGNPDDWFAGLMRRRAFASVDTNTAAAWALAATLVAFLPAVIFARSLAAAVVPGADETPPTRRTGRGPRPPLNLFLKTSLLVLLGWLALPLLTTAVDAVIGPPYLPALEAHTSDEVAQRLGALLRTVLEALAVTALSVLLALAAAARIDSLPRRPAVALAMILMTSIVVPGPAIAFALETAWGRFGLEGWMLAVPGRTGFAAACLLSIFTRALARRDRTLEWAARDLGAGPAMVMTRVVLPSILPLVPTAAVLAFALAVATPDIGVFADPTGRSALLLPGLPGEPDPTAAAALVVAALAVGVGLAAMRPRPRK